MNCNGSQVDGCWGGFPWGWIAHLRYHPHNQIWNLVQNLCWDRELKMALTVKPTSRLFHLPFWKSGQDFIFSVSDTYHPAISAIAQIWPNIVHCWMSCLSCEVTVCSHSCSERAVITLPLKTGTLARLLICQTNSSHYTFAFLFLCSGD